MIFNFKNKELEILISNTDFKINENIIEYDLINIKVANSLLQFIQIAEVREAGIPVSEQVKWALHAKLEKSLENYYYAVQVFQETTELLVLVCVIEKKQLDNYLEQIRLFNRNIQAVYSEDKQFVLYTQKILFWNKLNLLARLNQTAAILSLVILICCLSGSFVLKQLESAQSSELAGLLQAQSKLSEKIELLKTRKYLAQEAQDNLKLNRQNLQLIYRISAVLPKNIFLRELDFSVAAEKIKLNGLVQTDGPFTNNLITKFEKIKGISKVTFSKIKTSLGGQDFETEISLAVKKQNKTAENSLGPEDNG